MDNLQQTRQVCQIQIEPTQHTQNIHKILQNMREVMHNQQEFVFQGDADLLVNIMQKIQQKEIEIVKNCTIMVLGDEIKPGSPKCFILTLVIGLICIFPFLFFCCQWWKRAVSQVFRINQTAYRQIARILQNKNLESVSLTVYDNYLSHKKLNIIHKALSKTQIKHLQLKNEAGAFDMANEQYSNFLLHIKPLTRLKLQSWNINWYNKSSFQEQAK